MKMTNHPSEVLRLGTRGSALALWQANWVKGELERHWPGVNVEIVIIKTTGDKILNVPLADVGGKGLFTKEIDDALLAKRIDIAASNLVRFRSAKIRAMHGFPTAVSLEICRRPQ